VKCLKLMLMLFVFCRAEAGVFSVPEFQVGDKPASNIVTPVHLVVVDQERTETLREREAGRVPAIFRHYTNAAPEAELKMLTAYNSAKEGFLKSIERSFKNRKLDAETVEQERFGRAVAAYQKANRSFPLTTNLATLWALGEQDQVILEDLTATLREAMRGYVRPDTLLSLAKSGPSQIRLVPRGSTNAIDLDRALARSTNFYRSNFVAVGRVRKDVQARFGSEEQWAGKFVSSFVRENCVCDEPLTLLSRTRRTDPIISAETYEAGAVVARAGELIDNKIKLALDELRRRTESDVIKAQVAEEKRKAETIAAELEATQVKVTQAENEKHNLRLVLAGAGALGVCMIGLLIARGRRPRTMALTPVGSANAQLPSPEAALAVPAVRASVVAEMTRWLKQHFAQRLITSNAAIAETQRLAALQVAELERRLEEMNGPLQNRLQAYEQRITELEHQLAAQGAENRELLKATIKMARERLEAQRSQSSLAVN
jgi:hypothetical protein